MLPKEPERARTKKLGFYSRIPLQRSECPVDAYFDRLEDEALVVLISSSPRPGDSPPFPQNNIQNLPCSPQSKLTGFKVSGFGEFRG